MPMENKEEPKIDSTEESEEFSFLQETIKAEPINKKKMANKFMLIALMGLVFGLFASLGFCAFRPWAESQFQKKSNVVRIPDDEDQKESGIEGEQVPEAIAPTLDVNSYKELYFGLTQIVSQANRSMVSVNGIKGGEGWIEDSVKNANGAAGLIVVDNGQELLILTESSILKDAEKWTITFNDGSKYDASLKKKDENLGFAMLAVNRSSITEATWSQIQTAVLGNSNTSYRGNPVIAIGNPFGYKNGLGYGVISSSENKIAFVDGEYDILSTDIPATATGTGALINLNGEILGIISQGAFKENSTNLINAFAISDLKKNIELLSNGSGVPYLGIKATEVTPEVAEAQRLPKGLYIKEIVADSPSMVAGIQSGDILTYVEDSPITSIASYHDALFKYRVGNEIELKGMRLGSDGYVDMKYTVTVGSRE